MLSICELFRLIYRTFASINIVVGVNVKQEITKFNKVYERKYVACL